MNITFNTHSYKPTKSEITNLKKEIYTLLTLLSCHPELTIEGEQRAYNVNDFKAIQDFEIALEMILKKWKIDD